jgi:polysaccharide export outer membrane protein
MGQFVSVFLVRAAGLLLAGLLLFSLFGHAHAQGRSDHYGLNRYPGDHYDTLPPGAAITPAPGYAPAQQSKPQNYPGEQPADHAGYRIVPQQPMPPLQQQTPQSQQDTYGYRPLPPQQQAQRPQLPTQPAQPMPARMAAPAASYGGMGGYVLGAGDKLKLTVYGETDLSGEFTVDGSGYARLPMIGQLRAAGLTAQQMEQTVANTLAQGYLKSPRVSVEVTTYRPFYVIGAVQRPGQYPYVERMNAMNAIALAGGFAPTAVESVVFLRREGSNKEEEVPVDRTTVIYPGDVIVVHNTLFSEITSWLSPFSGVAAAAATAAVIQ